MLLLTEDPTVWTRFVPLSLVSGFGIGLTVATWSSAGLADIPTAKFGVAGATVNTIRQAAYALGISVTITLLATGVDDVDLSAYRWAWGWITLCYLLAGLAVVLTFPSGSSQDRALA